jgi:hypothetical protein
MYFHNSIYNLYLETSQIPNSGSGVFTKDFIPNNTFIDEYVGDIYTYNPGGFYVVEINTNYFIDAKNYPRCFMSMINDCEYITKQYKKKKNKKIDVTPKVYYDKYNNKLITNCQFVYNDKKCLIYSTTDILSDSELFISYGADYWL